MFWGKGLRCSALVINFISSNLVIKYNCVHRYTKGTCSWVKEVPPPQCTRVPRETPQDEEEVWTVTHWSTHTSSETQGIKTGKAICVLTV